MPQGMDMASQLGVQLIAVVAAALWSAVASFVLIKLLGAVTAAAGQRRGGI